MALDARSEEGPVALCLSRCRLQPGARQAPLQRRWRAHGVALLQSAWSHVCSAACRAWQRLCLSFAAVDSDSLGSTNCPRRHAALPAWRIGLAGRRRDRSNLSEVEAANCGKTRRVGDPQTQSFDHRINNCWIRSGPILAESSGSFRALWRGEFFHGQTCTIPLIRPPTSNAIPSAFEAVPLQVEAYFNWPGMISQQVWVVRLTALCFRPSFMPAISFLRV